LNILRTSHMESFWTFALGALNRGAMSFGSCSSASRTFLQKKTRPSAELSKVYNNKNIPGSSDP
jgi:hypothetical protein